MFHLLQLQRMRPYTKNCPCNCYYFHLVKCKIDQSQRTTQNKVQLSERLSGVNPLEPAAGTKMQRPPSPELPYPPPMRPFS